MNTPVSIDNISVLAFSNLLFIGITTAFGLGLSIGGVDLTSVSKRGPTVVFLWLLSFAALPFAGKEATGGRTTYAVAVMATLAAVIVSTSALNKVVRRHTKPFSKPE